MKQTSFMSALEAGLSTAAGFGISLLAQMYFLPMLGVTISLHQNVFFAIIMTFVSLARQFILRRVFEALHIRVPMSPALVAIAAERQRQQDVEGFSIEHDDKRERGELAAAGACYALLPAKSHANICKGGTELSDAMPPQWPWNSYWWKPEDDRRNLVRAGALIAAELERLLRNRKRTS